MFNQKTIIVLRENQLFFVSFYIDVECDSSSNLILKLLFKYLKIFTAEKSNINELYETKSNPVEYRTSSQ